MANEGDQVQQTSNDDEIDLLDLLSRLWAGKFTIFVFIVLAGLAGIFYILNTPRTYQADGLLQLEEKSSQLALPSSLADLSGDSPRAVTEIEIIKSRLVLGRAVSRLNLAWIAEPVEAPIVGHLLATQSFSLPDWAFLSPFARQGDEIELQLLDVPAAWLGEDILLEAAGTGAFDVWLPDGRTVPGQVGDLLIDPETGFSLRVGVLVGQTGRQYRLVQLPETEAIQRVRERLTVAEQGRNSGILRLEYRSQSPELARRTLDAIAQAYLAQNAERSAAEAESSLAFIEGQIPDARQAVQEAEAALNAYRQEQQAINLGAEGEALLTQIRAVETELLELDALEEELAERYTPNHPEYQRLLGARGRAEARLAELEEEVRTLPATQREVINLTQDVELAQEVFIQLRNRAQELEVLRASTIGNVRVIDSARTAIRPVAPRTMVVLALSLILGTVLGMTWVLLRSYLRKTVDGAEDLEALGLPVFATLNKHPAAARSKNSARSLPLVAIETPDSLFVEGLRSLRTSLHFAMLDAKNKSLVLTSTAPGSGKSLISANLAAVAAEAGQRVCLMDADMRRGQQRKYFDIPRDNPGLAQVLAGETSFEDAVLQSKVDRLSVLPAGPFPPNPAELLMRPDLAALLARLDQEFDLTIIDAPPVLAVTDPVVLGRAAGAVIAVTRFAQTHPGEVQAMLKVLGTSGVKVSGAILNDFDPKKAKSRGGYGYAYNTRYSYK
ncbi:polysaccharide biosynthesis tyrosine autokinase [Yoonia litorea]|uniref:Tyrosine-protein kinase Etk/Wzc n=1 Tax=Yoonia litorea TaxID=1123755 RepID=A0A1I6LP31_9RHOB|nr:polysaccharide biosynthesis tyrosine autokinase [Yoonia litorea]SFS05225.1 tyrosine-protein kinase Etk/Wzc [Yoonia litorea]